MRKLVSKALIIVTMVVIMTTADASVSIVRNGSFEYDGGIGSLEFQLPSYWQGQGFGWEFSGSVWADWSGHGSYYLSLYSNRFEQFTAGDMVTVWQDVYLDDVEQLIFDIALATHAGTIAWDGSLRSAVVLIDDQVVWQSPAGNDIRGEYLDQVYVVDEKFKDGQPHRLSLALRADATEFSTIRYYAMWDFVKFDTHCGGFGYLPGDLNRDCYVDFEDVAVMAYAWLGQDPNSQPWTMAHSDRASDMTDMAVVAADYGYNTDWRNYGYDDCVELSLLRLDFGHSGQVDYADIVFLFDAWLDDSDDSRADLNGDGFVDFYDFAEFANSWQQRSWIYGLN